MLGHRPLRFRCPTTNNCHAMGPVKDIKKDDGKIIVTIETEEKVKKTVVDKDYVVILKPGDRGYDKACLTEKKDLVEVRGPQHKTGCIIPQYFQNYTIFNDNRIHELLKLAALPIT